MNEYFEPTNCKRCKKEIKRLAPPRIDTLDPSQHSIMKPNITMYPVYIKGYGTVCWHCAEILAGDDDYTDPVTGEKIL